MVSESSAREKLSSDQSRRRKWAGARFLHHIMHQPPYRYHSIAYALEATFGAGYNVSQTVFVTRMMAEYKFDRKLRMDIQLRSFYDCFEGARVSTVDYRDILSCFVFLQRFKEVRDNPRKLFRDLVLLYSDEMGDIVQRQDALRVVRMGGIDEGDFLQTSTRLDKYLVEQAGSRGLKPTFRYLNINFLMEVIEGNPSVLAAFGTQLWQNIPESWRMGLLQEVELIGFEKAGSGALAMKQRRAARWYANKISRRMMVGWKTFRDRSKQVKAQRATIKKVLRRQAIFAWHKFTSQNISRLKHQSVSSQRGRICTLRRFFNRIIEYADAKKRLATMTSTFGKHGKLMVAGVGLLRGVLRKRSMRLTLQVWCETASLMNAWEFVVDLSDERLYRRVFAGLKDIVKEIVTSRRIDDEAETRAAGIAEAIEEAEKENELLAMAAEAEVQRQKSAKKAALMAERAAAHQASLEAARAEAVAKDAAIVVRQREVRRRRVYGERVRVKNEFDAVWEVKLKEIVENEMEGSKKWLESDEEAHFKVEKELQVLKRKFYAAPAPETAELEKALRDPANVIFAHMANLLYQENKTLHKFFDQFDKEGDGYLAHEDFKGMVSSMNIKLSGEQLRSVIRAIDLDGGGFIDFPEFEAAVKRHEEVCGEAGSGWKMYISPVHAIMILHNVETNEELWDYKATDADLVRVVKDNIVGFEGIAAKKRAAEERQQAWEGLLKDRAATTVQRQYHIWAARKKRSLIRWKWDVEKAREKNKTIKLLVTKLQCWWRGLRAKWLALCLLQITVEVLWDPGSNQKYYFNHGLGEAFWELPSMLQRWHGKSARMPDVPEWVLISRIFGQSYFYNTRSRLGQDEKPPGYARCYSCQTQLATRRCTVDQRDLCFVCYRQEHLQGDEGCWHPWEPAKTYTCRVCGQRDATIVCTNCNDNSAQENKSGSTDQQRGVVGGGTGQGGLTLCDNCWDRTHSHSGVRHHRGVTVEQWVSRDRASEEALMLEGGFLEESGQVVVYDQVGWENGVDDDEVAAYAGAEQFGHETYQ